jgi:hypothetical protein
MIKRSFFSFILLFSLNYSLSAQTAGCINGNCDNGYGTKVYDGGGKYEGYFINGLRQGEGTYEWSGGDKYSGHWVAGDYTGYGTYYYSSGTIKSGYWNKNTFVGADGDASLKGCIVGNCTNGYGVYFYASGDRYSGEFKEAFREGEGTYTWSNGEKFVGHWIHGDYDGLGTYYYANGTSQYGNWEKSVYKGKSELDEIKGCVSGDCVNGSGTYQFENGEKYQGKFKNYLQEGYGTYTWTSGDYYSGYWKAGKQEGPGTVYYASGNIQTGYWANGTYLGTKNTYKSECLSGDCDNGYGTYTWENGEKFEGYWKNNKRNGQGTNNYGNGDQYTGNWLDDQQNGYGTYKYSNGDVYVGDWKLHKKDGYGTYTFKNGEKYIGEWKDNRYNGQGTFYYADGTTKSGGWVNDVFTGKRSANTTKTTGCISGNCDNGYGVYVFDDGERYEGYWKNNKRNGQGTNNFANGGTYTGEWRDDLKHGYGTYTYPASSEYDNYQGFWTDDKMNGRGVLVYRNKQKYEGTFKDFVFEGEGTMYFPGGKVQAGIWRNQEYAGKSENNYGCISGDCNNGYGTYAFESGDKFQGNFKNGAYQGEGTYYFANGDKYVGQYWENKRNGKGTYTFSTDGRKYIGDWKDDLYEGTGTMYYSNGTIQAGTWKNGSFVGESGTNNKMPSISWISPENFSSSAASTPTMVRVCIESSASLKNASIYLNGQLLADKLISSSTSRGNGCDYSIERSINLKEGSNQLKVTAQNEFGTATSEIRTINYMPSSSENRLALVIGNSAYGVGSLKNPVNDATDIANELKKLGFEVMLYTDAKQADMLRDIRSFGEKLAAKKGVGLFYFAGHGIQMNGNNYLIPVDAVIEKEQDVELESVNLMRVMGELEYAQNETNIVILDACRNNPFARSFRSGGTSGLATTMAPQGTMIAYATAPGSVASDGSGDNGLYTQELLNALEQPGLKIEDLFKKVRTNVFEKSYKQQVPWENSSLFSDFYFKK